MLSGWTARLLVVAGLVLTVVLGPFGSPTAQAADCKPSGVPNAAGSGVPGLIDDPTANPSGETYYGEYGWAGLKWYTCDLGSGPDAVADPIAVLDTFFGNVGMGTATVESSSMTQLHEWALDPGELLEPVDEVVAKVTRIMRNALWNEWAPIFVIIAAIVIVWHANTQQVRRSLNTVVAILIACGVVGWIMMGPVKVAQTFDDAVSSIVGGVDESIVNVTGNAELSDEEARGATFHDEILYRLWCRGALSNEKIGDDHCPALYEAGAVSYEDLDDYDSDEYRDNYNDVASDLEDEDESYYDALKGKQYNRSGQGFIGFLMMTMIALIRIPAEILMVAGLLVMRLAVMLGPIFALAGILEASRSIAIAAFRMVLASVINVAVYGIIAALHTAMIAGVIAADPGMIATLVLVTILTFLFWKLSKPFRSPTKLASGSEAGEQMAGMGDTSRLSQLMTGLLGAKLGGAMVARGAGSDDDDDDDGGPRAAGDDRDEGFTRPDDGPDDHPGSGGDDGGDEGGPDDDGAPEQPDSGGDPDSDDVVLEQDVNVEIPDYVPVEFLSDHAVGDDDHSGHAPPVHVTDRESAADDSVLAQADDDDEQGQPEPDLSEEEVSDYEPVNVASIHGSRPVTFELADPGEPEVTVLATNTHTTHEVTLIEPEFTSDGDLSHDFFHADREETDDAVTPSEGDSP